MPWPQIRPASRQSGTQRTLAASQRQNSGSAPPPSGQSRSPHPARHFCLIDPTTECPIHPDNIEPLLLYITTFLDRAYLRQQVHRQHIEFSVVLDISFALTSTLSLQKIYEQLLDPVRRTLIVESISVGLIDQTPAILPL